MLGRKKLIPYLFISPFFITFLAFQVGPIFYGFWMSFQEIMAVTMPTKFVGWTNYINLLTNDRFYNSLRVSVFYTLGHGALHIAVALVLALILNLKLRGRNAYRMIFFLPVVTSLAVSAVIWRLILDDKVGLANLAIKAITGLPAEYRWLTSPGLALTSIIIIGSWRWFGFQMIIMLAGLQNIPEELYDAAKVDGASPMQIIWHITLPLLFPVLFFCIAITIIGSLMLFEEPFILTQGGPKDTTMSLAMYLYKSGFQYFKLGYASALGYVMALLIMGVAYLQVKILGSRAGLSS
jgi:ABC-type sugar transport system permease subunit